MLVFRRASGVLLLALLGAAPPARPQGVEGYYRHPAVWGDTVVFAAEGDLWSVPLAGGLARRLTTHAGEESDPAISPDGTTLAFSAAYEGPTEVYTMPLAGGPPRRRTWEAESSIVDGWSPDGRVLYATSHYSTLPDLQLVELDVSEGGGGGYERIALSQASEGAWDADGATLYFVRPAYHGNVTKRYRGGTARKIWRYRPGAGEAEALTADFDGESHTPMPWAGRVYFISDRDGTMNLWSMEADGSDLRQHTRHAPWDVRDASLGDGRVVYQVGADLWVYDVAGGESRRLAITLASDVDQWRDKWVKKPMEFLTSAHLDRKGERVALTSRGRVFVAPVGQGRLARASSKPGVRYRDVVFMPDGKRLLGLSDESGEFEFVEIPADGVGAEKRLTDNGSILRYEGVPSPDGKHVAFVDHNRDLWLLDVESGEQRVISTNREWVQEPAWSPDSRWLTFTQVAENSFNQVWLHSLASGASQAITSDRMNSWSAAWDPGGERLYFLSDRDLESVVGSPWGTRQPEPYFDRPVKVYELALREGLRSPFSPDDELAPSKEDGAAEKEGKGEDDGNGAPEPVVIDLAGLAGRLRELPAPPGNYDALTANDKALFWLDRESGRGGESRLTAFPITNEDPEPATLVAGVAGYDLSGDGKKLLARKGDALYVFDAATEAPAELDKRQVDLSGWTFAIDVRQDWRQMFIDAWRMERDFFYDPGMHGVDWQAVRDRYLPLVDRVTTRAELSELIGRVVGELSALHVSVRGGEHREGEDQIAVASLGARFVREEAGDRIDAIYRADPDYPAELSPLAAPGLGISEGDVVTAVNGVSVLAVGHLGELLRGQEGRQVRLAVRRAADGEAVERIVVPIADERSLRYQDWKLSRRQRVEEAGEGKLGYVHLRNMGSDALTEWYRQFYPVFDRAGLIIDVRHNNGGNVDSILLEKLLRRAWFYWKGRVERPYWNMQYAFRGHMVVLCDHRTASDGEAFAEGFRRLGLGKVLGTRTWGGEIWLNSANRLTDRGWARAPMWGVYGPEGEWLIEQRGVEPDIVVDNPPHATFAGDDAQLDAAVEYLLQRIAEDPRPVPAPPPYPDRSFEPGEG